MATRDKNIWILLIFLLAGLVLGGLLRRTSFTSRFFMVVIIWREFWFSNTNRVRFKGSNNNFWVVDQIECCKYNRYGDCNIYI